MVKLILKLSLNSNVLFLITLEPSNEANRANGNNFIDFSCNRLIAELLFSVQDAFMVLLKHFCYCSPVSQLESNTGIKTLCVQKKCNEIRKLHILLPPNYQQLLSFGGGFCFCFSMTLRKQNVAYRWKREKKRHKLREEKTLSIWYETSYSKVARGLEWVAKKMWINKI